MRLELAIAMALGLILSACSGGSSDVSEAEKLMQASRDWSKAAAAEDPDAVLAYFADDAVMISDSQPPVRGKEAIRAYLAEADNIPGFRIEWEPLEANVSGDMGYLIERTKVTMNGPDGMPVTQQLQALTVWRKHADGTWKNVVDMTTPAAPVAQAAKPQS